MTQTMADTARNKYVRNFKNGELSYKKTGKMKTVYYPIGKLIEAEYNPRQLTKEQYHNLKDSMSRFGIVDPLIVNTHKDRKNILVGGHQRLRVARDLGLKDIPCVEVDLNPDKEKELNIRLNKNVGEWDFDALANYFDVGELTEWGFTDDELQFYEDEPTQGLIDDDEIPEVEEAITKQGDLWLLGEHRVLCGDATKKEDVERLMDGQKADICFTSPPYNAGKTPTEVKSKKQSKYANDLDNKTNKDYLSLLEDFTLLALVYCHYVFVNIQSISGNKIALIQYLHNLKERYADTIIWNKKHSQPAMAENVLNSEYEYIHCFSEKANRHIGVKKFRGTLSNIIDIHKQTKNKVKNHNATFPVNLALHFVNNFSNNTVLDTFLGSGSTLIACEKTKRKCYGMEIDPHYCDVIVKRWEEFTGNKAERIEAASA